MLLDPQRVLPEHLRRERLVDIGMDRLRTEEGLAQADVPGVGVDLDPDDVGKLGQADRFDPGDFHSSFCSFCSDRMRQGIAWSGNSRGYSV